MDIKHGKYWDQSWNPTKVKGGGYHCTKCSPGCAHCWAEQYNMRFHNHIPYDDRPVEYVFDEKILQQPLRRKKPTVYFVCDLCDLFHPQVPFEFIDKVMAVITLCHQHTFLILTKRAGRMLKYFNRPEFWTRILPDAISLPLWFHKGVQEPLPDYIDFNAVSRTIHGPLPNVYSGLTICNQAEADEKIPAFLQIPGYKWLSIEPCLTDINIHRYLLPQFEHITGLYADPPIAKPFYGINQVIVGGESGRGARPMHPDWPRSLRDQCKVAGVPFFFKQWGSWQYFGEHVNYRAWLTNHIGARAGDYGIDGRGQYLGVDDGQMLFCDCMRMEKMSYPISMFRRVGKKKAGRLLDGVEHNKLMKITKKPKIIKKEIW